MRTHTPFRQQVCAVILALVFSTIASLATAQETTTSEPTADAALSDLIEVLKDDQARAALIAELEGATNTAETISEEAEPVQEPLSFGEQVAQVTQTLAQDAAASVTSIVSSLRGGQRLLRGLDSDTWAAIGDAALELALVIVVTVGVFIVLRRLTVPALRRIGEQTRGTDIIRAGFAVVASVVIRVMVVIVAWAIAYGLTLLAVGTFGEIGLRQSLFLNAFLIVELVKVAVRTVFSPAADDLRGLPMTDLAARRISGIASVAITILGYGVMLVVPIVSDATTFLATRAVSVLVVELTLIYLAFAVIWYRQAVSDWVVEHVLGPVAPGAADRREGVVYTLLTHWHWFALGYLAMLSIQMLTRSLERMGQNVLALIEIGAAAFAGALILRFLARRTRAGVRVPEQVTARLPLLEGRLNRVVPRVLPLLRGVVAILVIGFALDRTGITNISGWLQGDSGSALIGTAISVVLILLVAYLLWLAVSSWIDFRLNPDYGGAPSSRETTLLALLKNAVTVALLILAVMFALSEMGLNIGPLIASAGVLGLAIGFGAQKLVQDIITGVFIQFENAINVGDVITVGGITGSVEKLTIRSVSLRDLHGTFHIIPFSSVDMVSNFTREFSYFVIDMGVGYGEDVGTVQAAMGDAFAELKADPDQGLYILGDFEFFGLQEFGDSAVVLRARIKTWPGYQWGVGRAYNRILKRIFDDRGIEIPFPHRTFVFSNSGGSDIKEAVAKLSDAT